jgi:TetR/AcrR family transcriptional regulator, regulator of cefoperazone and chloramphenicol sensitivity
MRIEALADAPAAEDLTAKARIRDAALRMFTEHGTDAATIRDIAKAAGVSPGLVRHHFGSKEALRGACDQYALRRLMDIKTQVVFEGRLADPGFLPAVHPTQVRLLRYLARSMMDGSAAAASLFDGMVELGERWITHHNPEVSADPRAFAAVLVAMLVGRLVLHDQVARVLGVDVFSPAGHVRTGKAAVDIHSHTLLNPKLAAQAHAAYDRLAAALGAASQDETGG